MKCQSKGNEEWLKLLGDRNSRCCFWSLMSNCLFFKQPSKL